MHCTEYFPVREKMRAVVFMESKKILWRLKGKNVCFIDLKEL